MDENATLAEFQQGLISVQNFYFAAEAQLPEHVLRCLTGPAVCGKNPYAPAPENGSTVEQYAAVGEQGIADTRTELQIFDLLRRGTGLVVRCGLFERILRDPDGCDRVSLRPKRLKACRIGRAAQGKADRDPCQHDGQLHRYLLTKLSEYSYGETVPLHKVVY